MNFHGGTLKALRNHLEFIPSGANCTIGSEGGTIDTDTYTVTNAATFAGSGTLTKEGSGTLEFTGTVSNFSGSIAVEDGVVIMPSGTTITAASNTSTATLSDNRVVYFKSVATTDSSAVVVADSADAACNLVTITLTSTQSTDGLKTTYFKKTATDNKDGTYTVTIELDSSVVIPAVDSDAEAPLAVTDEAVSLKVDNVKRGFTTLL